MRKILMMTLFITLPLCAWAQGQEKPSAMELVLSQKKPRALQLQLAGASSCGGVVDCNKDSFAETDPCQWDKLTCHLESFSRTTETSQSWLLGGVKLQAEVGPVTFSVGRHKDNFVLSRAPFIEGTYRTGFRSSVSLGVLQTPLDITGSQNLWYVVYRKTF